MLLMAEADVLRLFAVQDRVPDLFEHICADGAPVEGCQQCNTEHVDGIQLCATGAKLASAIDPVLVTKLRLLVSYVGPAAPDRSQ